MRHAEDAQDSSMTAFKLLKTEWVLVGVRGKTSLLSLNALLFVNLLCFFDKLEYVHLCNHKI